MENYVTTNKSFNGESDLLSLLKQKANVGLVSSVIVENSHNEAHKEESSQPEKAPSLRDILKNKISVNGGNNCKDHAKTTMSGVSSKHGAITSNNLRTMDNSSSAWDERDNNKVSLMDLTGQQRLQQIQARKFTGWKVDQDGQKVYTTFRNGERVQASGREGFMLAYGDGAIKKKTTEGKRSIDEVQVGPSPSEPCTAPKPKKKVTDFFTLPKS